MMFIGMFSTKVAWLPLRVDIIAAVREASGRKALTVRLPNRAELVSVSRTLVKLKPQNFSQKLRKGRKKKKGCIFLSMLLQSDINSCCVLRCCGVVFPPPNPH